MIKIAFLSCKIVTEGDVLRIRTSEAVLPRIETAVGGLSTLRERTDNSAGHLSRFGFTVGHLPSFRGDFAILFQKEGISVKSSHTLPQDAKNCGKRN